MILSRTSGVLAVTATALLLSTVPATAGAGTWTTMPATVSSGVLTAVDARTDSDAWAIGTAGILRWTGTTWTAVSTAGLPAVRMNGVSASGANDAWIVGSVGAGGYSNRRGTALHWDGTAWSVLAPTLSTRSDLLGVAALSATNAWAVGKIGVLSLVEHWDGTTWTQASVPEPSVGYSNGLVSVSARAANDIWAVGTYVDPVSGNETYSVHFDGAAWSVVPMPKAPETTSFPTYTLTSVTALSSTDAWAVGQVSAGAPTDVLIEHWNGTAWSVVTSPTPGLYPVVRSVAARSANDVWAVGDIATSDSTPQYRTFTLHWNGASWSRVASPPTNAYSELYGVAAKPGTTHIWAVGNDDTGAPFIIERH
jgi:hypothetical protein